MHQGADAGPSAAPASDPLAAARTPAPAGGVPAAAAPPVAAAPEPGQPSAPAAPAASDPTPAASATVVADNAAPDLVEAAPGVQVVADYDAPVFFNAGMYWRFNDNHWYSSSVYTGGWAYRASPPSR